MHTKLNQAMLDEIKTWWEQQVKNYEPKDPNDTRLDAIAELMFLFSTQYLIINNYSEQELETDLATQFRLYKPDQDDE